MFAEQIQHLALLVFPGQIERRLSFLRLGIDLGAARQNTTSLEGIIP